MSFINCFLKKKNGDIYLPKTTAQNVSLADGTDLETTINSGICKLVEVEGTVANIGADGSGNFTINFALPTGYRVASVTIYTPDGNNRLVAWLMQVSTSYIRVGYINHRTSAIDLRIQAKILCIKA